MELYKLDSDLEEYSCGEVDLPRLVDELQLISANGDKKYNDETEAIPATLFIAVKGKKDFLRVECHSSEEIHFSSDRLIYEGGWLKKLFAKRAMQFRTLKIRAPSVLERYFNLGREEFEQYYSSSYTQINSFEFKEIAD